MRLAAVVLATCLTAAEDPFAALAPYAVDLVYAGPSTSGSAGMFGHVLLRLRGATGDVAVSYAAFVADDAGFSLACKALSGGYEAGYEITPWADTQRLYQREERRPIWIMELGLAPGDVRRLLDRLAADLPQRRPYRLFTDNCAGGIATLLDAAQPGAGVRARLGWWQLPADVPRAAYEAGLTGEGRLLAAGWRKAPSPERHPVPWAIGVGGGATDGTGYLALSARAAWHRWDDPVNGTGVGEGCELLAGEVRWQDDGHAPDLAALTLLAVDALSPPGRRGGAWRLAVGSRQAEGVQRGELDGGYGVGWAPHADMAAFALASARVGAGSADAVAVAGIDAGLRWRRRAVAGEVRGLARSGAGTVHHERRMSLAVSAVIDTDLVLTGQVAQDEQDGTGVSLGVRWLPGFP